MNVSDLKKFKQTIEKLDSTVKKMEYSEQNTLPDSRKALHRDLLIPMMDQDKKEMLSVIDEAIKLAEKEGLKENEEIPIPQNMKEELEPLLMAMSMMGGLADLLDGVMEADLK